MEMILAVLGALVILGIGLWIGHNTGYSKGVERRESRNECGLIPPKPWPKPGPTSPPPPMPEKSYRQRLEDMTIVELRDELERWKLLSYTGGRIVNQELIKSKIETIETYLRPKPDRKQSPSEDKLREIELTVKDTHAMLKHMIEPRPNIYTPEDIASIVNRP